jgi:hypothetical protein
MQELRVRRRVRLVVVLKGFGELLEVILGGFPTSLLSTVATKAKYNK